jgi:predicted nucleic acid-binding protein
MGLVLDSSVVIAGERRGENVTQMLKHIRSSTGDQLAVLSSVGLTELLPSIYRANTPDVRTRRDLFIRELLEDVEVYPYTRSTALLAGRIDGEQRNRGITIPVGDLLIGATALEIGYSMITINLRHFKLIPDLEIRQV